MMNDPYWPDYSIMPAIRRLEMVDEDDEFVGGGYDGGGDMTAVPENLKSIAMITMMIMLSVMYFVLMMMMVMTFMRKMVIMLLMNLLLMMMMIMLLMNFLV
ncbi:uncharacterized protein [Spinacia oleracea]|uniref:Uncharacterized protein n=1 Tax=Spinacia oleracea TaxID=3562 RepID=A0ABM3RAR8_SPIOL|nr:uncharacterized protein LOC130467827 [Spinacia oleracea]